MSHIQTYKKGLKALAAAFFLTICSITSAEDTEIFSNDIPASPPNILVILDNSASMNNIIDGSTETRMEALTAAFSAFINNDEITDVNIGLMAFSNGYSDPRPHGVSVPVSPIDGEITPITMSNIIPAALSTGDNFGFFTVDDDNLPNPITGQTVREYLPEVINNWNAGGGTPIVDSLYEAALYFKGTEPKWGSTTADQVNAAHPASYVGQIIATTEEVPGGWMNTCVDPDCGVNCTATTTLAACGTGETSCGTGNNCSVQSYTSSERCNLRTAGACMIARGVLRTACNLRSDKDACLASRPAFTSCSAQSSDNCTTTCSTARDTETNECLGTETTSCDADDYFRCEYEQEYTTCDQEVYQCEAMVEQRVDSGSATYISPLNQRCQSSTLILMSDGIPNATYTEDEANSARDEVKTLIGHSGDCAAVDGQVTPNTEFNTLADGRCGPELVEHLATVDQNDSVDGDNLVKTFTVGFAVEDKPEAKAYLKSLAASGGGEYYPADNEAQLASAFMSILKSSLVSRSFAAPVYTVDPDSLIAHGNDIFLPLFKNASTPAWSGNLKKFKLNNVGEITDANGLVAFDDQGQLKPEAIDYWMPTGSVGSTTADPITTGGLANNLAPGSRNVLTNNGTTLDALNNTNVSKADLGNTSLTDDEQTALINYIQGYEDDGTTARNAMGDILHSKPTFISYGANKKVLFFGTNEGLLHAIDAADASPTSNGGTEIFAFMPSSLLKNIAGIKTNAIMPEGGLSRIYGVDGSITALMSDENKNGMVDGTETATLVFGLRRGGNEYYALDVTNPDSPSLKWKISADSAGFAKLGETWSKPKPAKLRYIKSGTSTLADVLVFGGGYDDRVDQADPALRSSLADAKGSSVYIVDVATGDLIWSTDDARGTKPQHSIPGDIRLLDMDDDGSIDRLYFGDTGGNIWRVELTAYDFETGRTRFDVKNNSQINRFANLAGSGSDSRKFFYEPDVSVFRSGGKEALILSIGSGYRAHPLNEDISDRFYVLSDVNVRSTPSLTEPALTDGNLADSSALSGAAFFPDRKGWYKELTKGSGEKVLASPITFMSKIAFTTFAVGPPPVIVDSDSCKVEGGNIASTYVLDLMTGAATADLDGDGDIDDDDENIEVPNGNILDSPQLIFRSPSNCTKEGCDQIVDLRVGNKLKPVIDENTVGGNNNLGDFMPKIYWLSQ